MISFICYGHENITSRHENTLEFTKDENLTLKGDCIVGVRADFQLNVIKEFIKSLKINKITIIIETIEDNKIIEKINAEVNPNFDSDREIVIRKSDFVDGRTFAIKADKAALELDKELIVFLKGEGNKIKVSFENES
jgi:uncharacterized protein